MCKSLNGTAVVELTHRLGYAVARAAHTVIFSALIIPLIPLSSKSE